MKRIEANIQTGEVREIDLTPEEIQEIESRPQLDLTPKRVTMRQARLALLRAGRLQSVNNAIASMQGPEGDAARIEWDYSNEVLRNQPLTIALAQIIGLTEQEMDALFVEASKL
jgi:hypothetical protein